MAAKTKGNIRLGSGPCASMASHRAKRDKKGGEGRRSGVYASDRPAAGRRDERLRSPFDKIYVAHERLVWWRLRRLLTLDEQGAAEDVFQEVFLTMNEYLVKKGVPDDVPRVLLAITENQVRKGSRTN
jgi:hypothetical protein